MVYKTHVDLNSDLGEGFGNWTISNNIDEEIIKLISSANIATGFHAGDPNTINKTIKLAKKNNVAIGCHPGYRDLFGFGRRYIEYKAEELINDILYQIGALEIFARRHDADVKHIKAHGALYMTMAEDEDLSSLFIENIKKINPNYLIFCMPNSKTFKAATKLNQKVVREFYADRNYNNDGNIVFTRSIGNLNLEEIAEKVALACIDGKVKTIKNDIIDIEFDSICVHSDTPNALNIILKVIETLKKEAIKISNKF